jgi:D-alanine-D-alanine ligase
MLLDKKSKIAVLCGGISNEREISLRSGKNCFSALKRKNYENTELIDIKSLEDLLSLKTKNIEAVLLATHGKYGEDGAIQGALEWLQIPYTGSSVLASALSMDKWITKQIATSIGLSCAKSYLLTKNNKKNLDISKIWKELSEKNGAIFFKPNSDGSSVNTFKIKSSEELSKKINETDLNNTDYIIEEYIKGREFTSSIIDINETLKVLPILELKPKNEFYDYEAKYTKGMTEFILPANLNESTRKRIEEDSLKIFTGIGCSSCSRVDFILSEDETPYMLEVNTLPGMTDTSDLPAQAKNIGIEYDDLVEIILRSARLHK